MSKQEKRAKTLIEFMGLKDPDLHLPDHDTWCLKLYNNKKLCRKIKTQIIKRESNEKIIIYEVTKGKGNFEETRNGYEPGQFKAECKVIYDTYQTDSEKIDLEYVIVKRGSNGFSQRLGFIDILYKIICIPKITYNNIELNAVYPRTFYFFFEVKTKKQTVGAIAREVEYYRSALNEILGKSVFPVVISPEKIPIDQFTSFSFEEILELEKEIESK